MPKGRNLLRTQFDKNQSQKEKPKDLFSRSELDEINKAKDKPKKPQTQSVRISVENVNKIKALSEVLQLNTMDEAITETIASREQELTDSQKAEYKTLFKIYNRKKHK